MTLELSDFQKLPKHKPKNYSISPECNYIIESATDINYIIWICSFGFQLIMIYINYDGRVFLSLSFKDITGKFLVC